MNICTLRVKPHKQRDYPAGHSFFVIGRWKPKEAMALLKERGITGLKITKKINFKLTKLHSN